MAAEREGREALFDAAVSALLRGWPALKMAVSNQFGGPQSQAKATWMEGATAQWMRENGERRVFRACLRSARRRFSVVFGNVLAVKVSLAKVCSYGSSR